MPRQPKVWQRTGRKGWWATLDGKQTFLSEDKKEAERLIHRHLAGLGLVKAEDLRLSDLVDLFLDGRAKRQKRQVNKKNKKELQQASLDEDDYVNVVDDDVDGWEEIKSSSSRSPKILPPAHVQTQPSPQQVQAQPLQLIPPQPLQLIQPQTQHQLPKSAEDIEFVNCEVASVDPDTHAKEAEHKPAWLVELEKRDKTPYATPTVGPPYTVPDAGAPYAQTIPTAQPYMAHQEQGAPYALSGVSTVAYVTTQSVPVQEVVDHNDAAPYCVAY